MPSFILICTTVWPQYTNVTDRQDNTDKQDNGPRRLDQSLSYFESDVLYDTCMSADVERSVLTAF